MSVSEAAPEVPAIAADIFCLKCGYNVRGLSSEVCPECGTSIVELRSPEPQIPWVHRRRLGTLLAYWKTVWFVMFRGKNLANEMAREVSYTDAQKFRWMTIGFAYLPILICNVLLLWHHTPSPTSHPLIVFFWTSPWRGALLHIALILCLVAWTGIPSYFFHPAWMPVRQQNRAIALSYYTSAAWSLLFIPAFGSLSLLDHPKTEYHWFGFYVGGVVYLLAFVAGILGLPLVLLKWYADLTRFARRVMAGHPERVAGIALLVPLFDLLAAGLILILCPAAVLFVWIVVRSFH